MTAAAVMAGCGSHGHIWEIVHVADVVQTAFSSFFIALLLLPLSMPNCSMVFFFEILYPCFRWCVSCMQNCHSRQIQVDLHRTLTSHVEFVRGSSAVRI